MHRNWVIDILLLFPALLFGLNSYFNNSIFGFTFRNASINLSVGLFCVWLSVRLIDSLIKRRESYKSNRLILFDHLTNPYKIIESYEGHYNIHTLKKLDREIKWFNNRWDRRKKFLTQNEVNVANKIRTLTTLIHTDLKNIILSFNNTPSTKENSYARVKELSERIENKMNEQQLLIDELLELGWSLSHPDEI